MRKSEPELFKDKIEVSLDGRQIFYLFFGGAVIACLLFVLGVMVGKRVESRSHLGRTAASASRDPLAALDQLDATSRGAQLSFQKSLAGGTPPAGEVERAIAELEKAQSGQGGKAEAHEAPAGDAAAEAKPEARKPEAKADKAEAKLDAKPEVKAEAKLEVKNDKPAKPEAKPDAKAEAKAEAKNDAKPDAKVEAKNDARKDAPSQARAAAPVSRPDADSGKSKYTLQLSSFQDRAEAEAFLGTLAASGYKAYIAESKVDGKGTFYRVRFGTFIGYDEAIAAKASFESKVQRIAYVTKL